MSSHRIDRIRASAYLIPTDRPESDGTLEWDATTIVVVEVGTGDHRGLGYSYADAGAAGLAASVLAAVIDGADAMDIRGSWLRMVRAVRNVGRHGVAASAIAALDTALWDLKARLLDLSLLDLLGGVQDRVEVYGSGGLVLDRLRDAAERHQLTFGPDPSTHNRCTLGGMIGNNSCGCTRCRRDEPPTTSRSWRY